MAHALRKNWNRGLDVRPAETFMANETEIFNLVLLIFLTLIVHFILTKIGLRRDGELTDAVRLTLEKDRLSMRPKSGSQAKTGPSRSMGWFSMRP
jgi:hypothetical protein